MTEKCSKGVFGTAAEAIADLSVPRVKPYRPYSTYKGKLSLGDFRSYPETAMLIDVERFFRIKVAKPVSASSFVTRSSATDGAASGQSSHTLRGDTEMTDAPSSVGDLVPVRSATTYKVDDPAAPGGKKDVEREELAKGYEYGRTAVHISESDENITKLETFSSFEIVGFIPNDKVCVNRTASTRLN